MKWSGREWRAGGRAVASLHNEQDAGTPRPPYCLHRNPPCLPVGASLTRPHPRPFVLSLQRNHPHRHPLLLHYHPQLHPSSTYYFSVLRYVALRYAPRCCSRLVGTAKMMIPPPRNKSTRSPRGRSRRPHVAHPSRFLVPDRTAGDGGARFDLLLLFASTRGTFLLCRGSLSFIDIIRLRLFVKT